MKFSICWRCFCEGLFCEFLFCLMTNQRHSLVVGGGCPRRKILGAPWRQPPWQLGCLSLALAWALRMGEGTKSHGSAKIPLQSSKQRGWGGTEPCGGTKTLPKLWAKVGGGSQAPWRCLPSPPPCSQAPGAEHPHSTTVTNSKQWRLFCYKAIL